MVHLGWQLILIMAIVIQIVIKLLNTLSLFKQVGVWGVCHLLHLVLKLFHAIHTWTYGAFGGTTNLDVGDAVVIHVLGSVL